VIYITHDIHLAATQSSHVAVIEQGTLLEMEPHKLLRPWSGIGSELRKNDE
jgi:ABC-type dipeptide/oligopeptide/nickel transport system ATPase component